MDDHVIEDRAKLPAIPGYELRERIGAGGMGRVYRATDLRRQRVVAIKSLTPPGESERRSMPDFHREARLMASVQHANVVATYDCAELDGTFYLVMEYVDGPNLRSLMRPNQLWSASQTVKLIDHVARALSSIHAEGIWHLDLKPENTLLDESSLEVPNARIARDATTCLAGKVWVDDVRLFTWRAGGKP